MPEFIDVCEHAAREGGSVLLRWQSRFRVQEKGVRDLVTEADLASQLAIRKVLLGAFPDHGFLGEERLEGVANDADPLLCEFLWVVDPLDGTTNYVHQLPMFATSVALLHRGQPIAGVVFDPVGKECFRAVSGGGALRNGRPLRTSDVSSLDEALVAASFSNSLGRDSHEIRHFVEMLLCCQGVRRMGSAALNLCYVAAGRFDGYWASNLQAWDIAAGILILQEAGGVVSAINGQPFDLWHPDLVAAANQQLHEAITVQLQQSRN